MRKFTVLNILVLALLFTSFSLIATAQTESVLVNFNTATSGDSPRDKLIFDSAGNLYGVSYEGGTIGYGTVYQLVFGSTPTLNVLYNFTGGKDSGYPWAGLAIDAGGNLYGTTTGGVTGGFGSVFELSPLPGGGWHETTLYTFSGGRDGAASYGQILLDSQGNLYGTTYSGGDLSACPNGCGLVFKLSRTSNAWKETILHTFEGGTDGAHPEAGLVFDTAGNLYGTTGAGGEDFTDCGAGCGVAFELSPNAAGGWRETVMHSFRLSDGSLPNAPFVFDAAGNLYSTTPLGGTLNTFTCGSAGCGTVYKLSRGSNGQWKQNLIHAFRGVDGEEPAEGGLSFDAAGNLYGTTALGGNLASCGGVGCGTVFKLQPVVAGSWKETVLYDFANGDDGGGPFAPPIPDSAGNLYGAATSGGTNKSEGVIYKIGQ
ncbi:MAG TPA: choice-of-anchor tandem repeat GloVer-containing protein [Candidatus Sulfotelmatobacter sp.]|jgi:uncharacterized repeat protein (TIGR03803 family)